MEWSKFSGYKRALCISIFIFLTGLFMLLLALRYKNHEYSWQQDSDPNTQARYYYELGQYMRIDRYIELYKDYFNEDEIKMYSQMIFISLSYERYCDYRDEIRLNGLENIEKNHLSYFAGCAYEVLSPWSLNYDIMYEENRQKLKRYQDEVRTFIVYNMDELGITEEELSEYIVTDKVEQGKNKYSQDLIKLIEERWEKVYGK